MKIEAKGWRIIIGLVLIGLFWAVMWGPLSVYVPGRAPVAAVVPKAVSLGNMANTKSNAPELPLPTADPIENTGGKFTIEVMAWNSQFPLMLANGGPSTTVGSLAAKYGVNLQINRQDDCEKMKADLVAFANDVHSGNTFPADKPAFVAIMGDGAAQFLAAINPTLKKLGDDYVAQIVASAGYSFGEDKLMGPIEWKRNPASMKGCVIAGYLRDGDWNIAMKYAADNGIKNNPDETTYDPNAINWVAANDFIDAAAKYIADFSEDRPVVINGKKTGEKKHITVQGVVTWTPGDVNVAEQKGGLVSIVSTKEYAAQMPNAIIGIKTWMSDNRKSVEGLIQAIGEAGDQIKQYPAAKRKAAEVSADVYKEKDADYWLLYHDGVKTTDKQGIPVELGGSKPNNLADMVLLFGPSGLLKSTYVAFGNVVVQQYPKLVKSFPDPSEAIDGSYVLAVAARTRTTTATADKFTFSSGSSLKNVVGKRKYQILFATGRATIAAGQTNVLESLKDELTVSLSLKVVIHGHTDSQGNANNNQILSEQRASAVKSWLENNYPEVFPKGRISIMAHGQDSPVASNATEEGRALNRRVEIVTGNE